MNLSYKPFVAVLTLFVSGMLFTGSCQTNTKFAVTDLECEYLIDPPGVDVTHPRFSWKIVSSERSVTQKAYRLIVGTLDEVNNKTGAYWDPGKITSDVTHNIAYEGVALESNKDYFWSVCVWVNDKDLVWSDPAAFHTGLLKISDWKGKWITPAEEVIHESPLLRTTFDIEKKVKSAFAYVTAAGLSEFYLNGEKVGDHVLDPAITNFRKTILYSTYDVTRLLRQGENVVGAMLGNGAYNGRKAESRYSWGSEGSSFGNPCLLAQIDITYSDGSQSVIATDASWKYAWGPVTFNNFYGGEDYDAQKEIKNWLDPEIDDSSWKTVVPADDPGGALKSLMMPAIKVTATIQPVAQTQPAPGVYLFDLGQNIAGWWRIHVKGHAGLTVRVRGAETLNDSLFAKPLEKGDVLSTKFRYHSEVWTDYTMKGDETEVYEPHFFYSGFRYIEVATDEGKDLDEIKVEGRVVRTFLERNGTFSSSDSLLNKIHRANLWAIKANTISYPTDCPHREKGAYNGDGQVIAETSIHDFDMPAFYTNWLNDMRDSQEDNGRIPNTSPTLVGGMGGGIAWGSAYILIPYWMHLYYNDNRVLKEHYPTMKRYIQYLKDLGTRDEHPEEPYIINFFDQYWYSLGEWCAPGQSDGPDHAVVNTFYYYYNTRLMSKIAGLLGKEDDARYFKSLGDTIKEAFNKKFFDRETGLYGTEETYQTYQLLPLLGDMVPEGYRDKVFNTIVEDIKSRDNHLNTGIIGTKYLWPVLTEGNQGELAYEVATQTTFPSYGYWLKNNATTLLEKWSGRDSHNHQMFGSVVEYFYKYLAGIRSPMEGKTSVGYQHVHLQPFVPDGLSSVQASVETVAGKISVGWEKRDGDFQYDISIPANTTGTVVMPVFSYKNAVIREGGLKIWDKGGFVSGVGGISGAKKDGDHIVVSIGSGEYKFRVSGKR